MVNGYYAADVRVLTAMGDSIGSAFVVLRSEHDAAVRELEADLAAAKRAAGFNFTNGMTVQELQDRVFALMGDLSLTKSERTEAVIFRNLRIEALEADLAKYQAARVRDVDEKAWLSKRMTALEAALRTIQQWDCMNPPAVELLQDLSWLRTLVNVALDGPPTATINGSAAETKGDSNGA